MYNPIGKTLAEIHKENYVRFSGYSVYVLQDENDNTGKFLDEDILISLILQRHPEYANYKVKYENDFYGIAVLRVEKGE